MGIITVKQVAKANPYAPAVAELVEATKSFTGAEDERPGFELVVQTAEAGTQRKKFGKAANDAGYTARVHSQTVEENKVGEPLPDGTTTFVFILSDKHAPRTRKDSDSDAAEVEESEEA